MTNLFIYRDKERLTSAQFPESVIKSAGIQRTETQTKIFPRSAKIVTMLKIFQHLLLHSEALQLETEMGRNKFSSPPFLFGLLIFSFLMGVGSLD
jgi:hypothetical protein